MGEANESALDQARVQLRNLQAEALSASGFSNTMVHGTGSTLGSALKALKLKQCEPTDDPDIVRCGIFKYDREYEEERYRTAARLIRRIDPGPYEDPGYLALLAYQAASIEMAIPMIRGSDVEKDEPDWSAYILGTMPARDVNAFAMIGEAANIKVIALNAALVDFLYQAAKATVEAQAPIRSTDRETDVTKPGSAEHVERVLDMNERPVQRIYATLEAYLFNGYPRASQGEEVMLEHHPPLSILIGMAERFVIAHEYGHVQTDKRLPDTGGNPNWNAEFTADRHATITLVWSAKVLDWLPPEIALSGAIFSLTCLDILRQAVSLLITGRIPEDRGSKTHPPLEERMSGVMQSFLMHFDAVYENNRNTELTLVTQRDGAPTPDPVVQEQLEGAFVDARALRQIWQRVREQLAQDRRDKRPLHPMWR